MAITKFNLSPNHAKKAETQSKIVEIYHDSNGTPGYRMMRDLLMQRKYKYINPTIHRYMKELGLHSITRRKKPNYKKGKARKVYPDLVNQNFVTESKNKI